MQVSSVTFAQFENLPGHGDDGRNCVVHGRLLSSLLVEHSQNSIYGYLKSSSSNAYVPLIGKLTKRTGGRSVYLSLERLSLRRRELTLTTSFYTKYAAKMQRE